jgi:5'-nucleotidase
MSNRRSFIKQLGASSLLLSLTPLTLLAEEEYVKISILHTNDIHSHIEPFSSGRNKGNGGLLQLAELVKQIRKEEDNVLLLDAGDIFQGTPYFNYFGGEVEFKLMSEMGYDAATLGNHDFDNGLDGLMKQLPHAQFPFLCANYDFSNTILKGSTQPFKIFVKEGVKIGVFGVGIELSGLVDSRLYGKTAYLDPIEQANHYAEKLKNEQQCDLVICLSHLGYKYRSKKVSDTLLAQQTKGIDLIVGGHTHSFLKEAVSLENSLGEEVLINQVGFGAIKLGKIDFYLQKSNKKKKINSASILVKNKAKFV